MRLSFAAFLCVVAVFVRAANTPPAEPEPITAKEMAQGYRDHAILARPKAAHRGSVDAAEAREGVHVREKFSRFGDLRIIDVDASDAPDRAVRRLQATGRYEFVEPDYLRFTATAPNDPKYTDGTLWGLNNTGVANGVPGADIHAAAAWDVVHDAPNVIVAIVDTGLNLNHEDVAGNLWTNPAPTVGDVHGVRILNGVRTGDPTDDNGHGTHVAGTIGAVGNNNTGVTGVAWRVQLMPIKVLSRTGSGSISDIARGVDYAVQNHAHIINASYGAIGSTGYSQTELTAITGARNAGIIFVAAAGNSTANMDVTRFYPASHALDNIVTVGASTRRDELAVFSNFGAAVDLFAPGNEIVSLSYSSNTGTANMSGTSMAAPHVTGALALLKAKFPDDNYHQLINRMMRGVDKTDRYAGKAATGGRLNVANALATTTNRPFNDDFADRPRLNSTALAIRASNAGATAEPGEPAHAGATATSTLWWEWVAPTTGTVDLDTLGSDIDTTLAVYTGTAVNGLTLVASNDDTAGNNRSRLSFTAQAGTTYEFAVDGKFNQTGLILLNLGTTPANDTFANAQVVTGSSAHLTATNAHCSREPGEPTILGFSGGLSLWYKWTAPRTGKFQFSAVSSDFDPIMGIFTGSAVNALTYVAESTGSTSQGVMCSLNATAGTTYYISVDSKSTSTIGQFTFSVTDAIWQGVANGTITGAPAIGNDGTIYVGANDNSLYAFTSDGSMKWTFPTSGIIDTCSPAIGDDGTIYVGSNDGRLYAVSTTGTEKWRHDFGVAAPAANCPAVAVDGTIYLKAGDGYLYALNAADGTTKWRQNVFATSSYASPAIAPDGTVYQGSENKILYALNPADGSIKWQFTADNDIYTVPAIDAAGNLYFSTLNSGKLFSITSTGTLRWTYSGASLGSSSSAALSPDGGTVYYGGYDGILHAVNTTNGVARWTYKLASEVRASSPAVDANGVIYIGCYDYRLYAVNPDGTLKRTWDTGNWIRSCPAIAGQRLYVGSNDHKLYAFDIGAGANVGPWPQFRHNARRIGRAIGAPTINVQPLSQTANLGSPVTLTTSATGDVSTNYLWQRNGALIAAATNPAYDISSLQPANAGVYRAVVSSSGYTATSTPAIVGVSIGTKTAGSATEVGSNIAHPNGNVYDQVLLTGTAASVTADPGQVLRISYIDLTDDIVQVEFAGAGTLTITLDSASGPAAPVNYNQPSVSYMKGHASIVVVGANETTNLSVFSVGRANAVNQALFKDTVTYDAVADIASISILSANGKFGGLRTANTNYFNTRGLTGIYAPDVQFTGPVFIGDIQASDEAEPVLRLGGSTTVSINGGDLLQPNGRAVQVSGFTQLLFVAGSNSKGTLLPAQTNRARLEQNGADVTTQIVVNPTP